MYTVWTCTLCNFIFNIVCTIGLSVDEEKARCENELRVLLWLCIH